MPRIFTLVSVAVHSLVLAVIFLTQAIDVGQLPMAREALAYVAPIARMAPDVPLPPPRPATVSPDRAVSPTAAPVEAPRGVIPETGLERAASTSIDRGPVVGVESGGTFDAGALPGAAGVPPPPPVVEQRPL